MTTQAVTRGNATMADNLLEDVDAYDQAIEKKFPHFIRKPALASLKSFDRKILLLLIDLHGCGGRLNLGGTYLGEGGNTSLLGEEMVYTRPWSWGWHDADVLRSAYLRKLRQLAADSINSAEDTSPLESFDGSWPGDWTIDCIKRRGTPVIRINDTEDVISEMWLTHELRDEFRMIEKVYLFLSSFISRGLLTAAGRIQPRNIETFPSFRADGDIDAWVLALEATQSLK